MTIKSNSHYAYIILSWLYLHHAQCISNISLNGSHVSINSLLVLNPNFVVVHYEMVVIEYPTGHVLCTCRYTDNKKIWCQCGFVQ